MAYFTRAAWGARNASSPGGTTVALERRDEFMAHYSTGEELGREDCAQWVREIQAFHMGPQRGWADIGYNFLVCKHGDVFEGRGWHKAGAHCPDHNTRAIGVCYLGNDDPASVDLTDAAKAAYVWLHKEGEGKCGPLKKLGHRDGKATTCPGDEIYRWIHAGMPLPAAPAPTPVQPAPSEEVRVANLPTIRPGITGPNRHVEVLQGLLLGAKHDLSQEGGVDGFYGPGTQRELNQFKSHRGLPADGVVDSRVWNLLLSV